MDSLGQTSFIPKKPLTNSPVRGGSSAMGMFFVLIATLFFIASLAAAGGAFVYKGLLQKNITDKSSDLEKAEEAFNSASIQDLTRLDSRINNAQVLLQKHVAATAVFAFLSSQTLVNVQFTGFTLEIADNGQPELSLVGMADSFSTVALQSDQFGSSKVLKDVVFSNIVVSSDGHITFNVKADVDPALLNYAKNTSAPAAQPDQGAIQTEQQ